MADLMQSLPDLVSSLSVLLIAYEKKGHLNDVDNHQYDHDDDDAKKQQRKKNIQAAQEKGTVLFKC